MPEDLQSVIKSQKAQIAAGDNRLLAQVGALYGGLRASLQLEAEALRTKAQTKALTPFEEWQLIRASSLLKDTVRELDFIGKKLRGSIKAEAPRIIRLGQAHVEQMTFAGNPGLIAAGYSFNRLDQNAAEQLLAATAGDKSPLAKLLKTFGVEQAAKIEKALFEEVITGAGPDKLARRLASAMGGNVARAQTIARTETFRAYRGAGHQTALENDDVLAGWYWNAALDSNGCASCTAMSGTFHKTEESLDSHPNCRCIQQWVTRSVFELGLTGMGESRVSTSPKGADWFQDQEQTVKQNILGIKGAQFYKDGLVKLEDFVGKTKSPVWGLSYYQMGLEKTLERMLEGKPSAHPGYKPVQRFRIRDRRKVKVAPIAEALVTPAPTPPMAPPPPAGFIFPESPEGLKVVRGLGGTTGAQLVSDAEGRLYVMKKGNSEAHLREEAAGDAIYQAAGVAVPEFRLYETRGGPVKLSRFIEGTTLDKITDLAEKARIYEELRKDFIVDALLGNRDVTGATGDNILIDKTGKVWRIDNGSSMRFRAQGAAKPFDAIPLEFFTMRDPQFLAGTYFWKVGHNRAAAQALQLQALRDRILDATPQALKATMRARLDALAEIGDLAHTFSEDRWGEVYAGDFARELMELRHAKTLDWLPAELKQTPSETYKVLDEKGKIFDSFRDAATVARITNHFRARNADFDLIATWADGQAVSSWSDRAMTTKGFFEAQRGLRPGVDFYDGGEHTGKSTTTRWDEFKKKTDEEKFRRSWAIQHALTYETVRRVKFRYNDQAAGAVRVIRTEVKEAMRTTSDLKTGKHVPRTQLKPGTEYNAIRGTAESASIFKKTVVSGDAATISDVPYHRIIGVYFHKRDGSAGFFAGDSENEFVFLPEGLPLYYYGGAYANVPENDNDWKSKRPRTLEEKKKQWQQKNLKS